MEVEQHPSPSADQALLTEYICDDCSPEFPCFECYRSGRREEIPWSPK